MLSYSSNETLLMQLRLLKSRFHRREVMLAYLGGPLNHVISKAENFFWLSPEEEGQMESQGDSEHLVLCCWFLRWTGLGSSAQQPQRIEF